MFAAVMFIVALADLGLKVPIVVPLPCSVSEYIAWCEVSAVIPLVAVMVLPFFDIAVMTLPVPVVTTDVAPPASTDFRRSLSSLPNFALRTHVAFSSA